MSSHHIKQHSNIQKKPQNKIKGQKQSKTKQKQAKTKGAYKKHDIIFRT